MRNVTPYGIYNKHKFTGHVSIGLYEKCGDRCSKPNLTCAVCGEAPALLEHRPPGGARERGELTRVWVGF